MNRWSFRNPITAGLVVALAAVAAGLVGGGPPAGAADTGPQVRLGHFAPGVPKVDVYLSAVGSEQRLVLPNLGYGEVSQYLPVPPGRYAYSMRRAGRPGTAPKLIAGYAEFSGTRSYTFIAFKDGPKVRTKAFVDDTGTPAVGSARIRLINTADTVGTVDVSVVDGPALANRLGVGFATGYATVPGGTWQVRIDGRKAVRAVDQSLVVQPGTVNTLVVATGPATPLILGVVDATGIAGTTADGLPTTGPTGGVQTGGGGTARTFAGTDTDPSMLWVGGTASALTATAALLVRRHRVTTA